MGRSPCCDKDGLKKGPWTPEEDQKLIDYIQKNGYGNWRTLPKNAGLQRCGKSCRLRWTNYLRPDIKRGRFSFEEEETIIQLHSILGNKWSAIAARLPGRTDNEVKNYWNTHIRKRLLRMGIDPVTHSPRLDLLDVSSILSSSLYNPSQMNLSRLLGVQPFPNYPELLKLATSLFSSSQQENQSINLLQQNVQGQLPPLVPQNVPMVNETELVEPNVEQFSSHLGNFGSESCQLNEWQNSGNIPYNLTEEDYASSLQNYGYYGSESSNFLSFPSGPLSNLSTPSSSPAPMNSNSTYINSSSTTTTAEDERESFCSSMNMFKFEIPDMLDVNDQFMCN